MSALEIHEPRNSLQISQCKVTNSELAGIKL